MNNPIYLKRGLLAVFSLTLMFAFLGGCTEDLAIDVEFEKKDTITVDITGEAYQTYLDSANDEGVYFIKGLLPTDQEDIDEYKDRVESMELEKVTVKMVNETVPPTSEDNFQLLFNSVSSNPNEYNKSLFVSAFILREGYNLPLTDVEYKSLEEKFLARDALNYYLWSRLDAPTKFDLEITVKGRLKVKAKAD